MSRLFPTEIQRPRLTDMANVISAWLADHATGTNEHGRVFRICRIVEESQGIIDKGDPQWSAHVQAFKDVQEFWYVIDVLGDRLLEQPFKDSFVRSLDDPILPADSGSHTPGRNAQFELFIAAAATRAGMGVERAGTAGADWVVSTPVRRWSIEAKRIKAWGQIEKRVRSAAGQIDGTRVGGIIAIDVSAAANPAQEPLDRFVGDAELERAQPQRGKALLNGPLKRIHTWIGRVNVGFLLLYDFVIRPAGESATEHEPWSLIGFWDRMNLIPQDSPHMERYDELWSLLEASLPKR